MSSIKSLRSGILGNFQRIEKFIIPLKNNPEKERVFTNKEISYINDVIDRVKGVLPKIKITSTPKESK